MTTTALKRLTLVVLFLALALTSFSSAQAELVGYWNFDEADTGLLPVMDQQDGNHGSFEGSATRTAGLVGLGAALFDNTAAAGVNVGPGTDNNFSVTEGITIEALIDVAAPMCYAADVAVARADLRAARAATSGRLWAGLGLYNKPAQ